MTDVLTDLRGMRVGVDAFLAAILQATAQPVLVVDADGLIRFANPAAVAALGYGDADELVGRHSGETMHSRRQDGPADWASETVTSELDWFSRRDGSTLPVSYVAGPLDMRDGRGAVVAFTDIQAPLRAEQLLRDREAAPAVVQASLRRVAALTAGGASSAEVFEAVAHEVAAVMHLPIVLVGRYDDEGASMTVLGTWPAQERGFRPGTRWPLDGPSVTAEVLRTGRPARIEDYADLPGSVAAGSRESDLRRVSAAPIVVDGRVWGVMAAASPHAPIPDGVEDRLADFTALVATAITNTQARDDLRLLAGEQAALRRVATLAAEGATPAKVFAAVAREVGLVLKLPLTGMYRYEPDGTVTVVGSSGEHPFQPGTSWPLDGPSLASLVRRTGRPARVEDYAGIPGAMGEAANRAGFTTGVGAPIVVDSEVWGVVVACSDQREPLSPDAERRLSRFTALVATTISNSQAHEDLRRLADEQAALRRVATSVAEGVTPAQVFAAVAREIGLVLKLELVTVFRYEADGTATVVGSLGEHPFRPGTNWPLDGTSMTSLVRRTGCPMTVEDYAGTSGTVAEASRRAGYRTGVAAPIVVDGEVWGVVCAGAGEQGVLVPPDAEHRLSQFTALVATAISNTQARADLSHMAGEQAALRRLATLVAQSAKPRVVFDAVCEETGRVVGASSVELGQFAADDSQVTVAGWRGDRVEVAAATRVAVDRDSVPARVRASAAPARVDGDGRSQAGAPVVVEGRVWGALVAASDGPVALAARTEHRLASFAELIATAVSNAAARSELVASRVRIVEAADEQRRRVVRDLHDGAQSRLIHTVMALERARTHEQLAPAVRPLVEEGLMHARSAIGELRELAHGIHPAILTHGGLAAAIEVLADRSPLPVRLGIPDERYPTPVESAAYFVAAEALTNVAKYAHASTAKVNATRTPAGLRLVVEDDGVGGARRAPGRGLAGLGDRLAALDGVLAIDSPPGGGTRICAEIPLPAPA
jgi:PAS domain S-box-containing protein